MKESIAHLTTVHIRTDTRIFYKEVQTLSKIYNTLLIAADGLGNSTDGFVEVVDLGKPKSRIKRILFYGFKALPILKKRKIKCVHIHDPELILVGFILRIKGYKVIYDIHELVYEDIRTKNWISFSFVKNTIAWFYKIMEGLALKYFNGIVLAEDGYRDFYEKYYPKAIPKIVYIRNYPIKAMFKVQKTDTKTLQNKYNSIIYLGAISEDRGIYELVRAMDYLDESYNLYIIGKWREDGLLERCKSLAGWSKVTMIGYIKPNKIGEYIQKSRVGICTLHKTENFAYTTPVKSFEYLINGLPMIMTDFPFWKKFYQGTSLFVDPKNSEEIAKAVETLLNDQKLYEKMSAAGADLALNHCWENEEKKLIDLYQKIV